MTRGVVDDLGIDLVDAAEHREPRPFGRTREVQADPEWRLRRAAPLSRPWPWCSWFSFRLFGAGDDARPVGSGDVRRNGTPPRGLLLAADLAGLAGLATDDLARVTHAFALVGLGLAHRSDTGGHVADELLVDTRHRESGGVLDLERDALGRIDLDGMAVAEAELELAPTSWAR